MAQTIPIKPIAWSWSAINNFQTCPRQYHEVKVLKKYKDDNEYNKWGDRVHKHFAEELGKRYSGQDRRNSAAAAPDPALAIYEPIIERFARIEGEFFAEQQLAITNAFRPTAWFGKDVWCRVIADALWINGTLGKTVDWKTGRRKPDSKQLLLTALLIFAHHPEVERVNTAFVWLQNGKVDVEKYKREDVPLLWQEILPDVRRFEMAHAKQAWVPKPSGLCRGYCKVIDCSFNESFKEHGEVAG